MKRTLPLPLVRALIVVLNIVDVYVLSAAMPGWLVWHPESILAMDGRTAIIVVAFVACWFAVHVLACERLWDGCADACAQR